MRDHLDHGAIKSHGGALQTARVGDDVIGNESSERHKSHVRDRGVSDQLLHVLLHERDKADIDDRDERQGDHKPVELAAGIGGDRQAESQEAVTAHLQHDGGENDGSSRRSFNVRVGEPGVHRPHRHFHSESQEKRDEDPTLLEKRQG